MHRHCVKHHGHVVTFRPDVLEVTSLWRVLAMELWANMLSASLVGMQNPTRRAGDGGPGANPNVIDPGELGMNR